jgi:hypothetical protein
MSEYVKYECTACAYLIGPGVRHAMYHCTCPNCGVGAVKDFKEVPGVKCPSCRTINHARAACSCCGQMLPPSGVQDTSRGPGSLIAKYRREARQAKEETLAWEAAMRELVGTDKLADVVTAIRQLQDESGPDVVSCDRCLCVRLATEAECSFCKTHGGGA